MNHLFLPTSHLLFAQPCPVTNKIYSDWFGGIPTIPTSTHQISATDTFWLITF